MVGPNRPRRKRAEKNRLGAISQPPTVRGKGCAPRTLVGEAEFLVGLAKLPKVTPFEAPQVLLAGLGPLTVEQLDGPSEVVFVQRLKCKVDLGCVGAPAGFLTGEFSSLAFVNGPLLV